MITTGPALRLIFAERRVSLALAVAGGLAGSIVWILLRSGGETEFLARVECSSPDAATALEGPAAEGGLSVRTEPGGVVLAGRFRTAQEASERISAAVTRSRESSIRKRAQLLTEADSCLARAGSAENALADVRSLIARNEAEHPGVSPAAGAQAAARYEAVCRNITAAESSVKAAGAVVDALKAALAAEPETVEITTPSLLTDEERMELAAGRTRLAGTRGRLSDMLRSVTELHPFAVKLSDEIKEESARIAPLEAKEQPAPQRAPNPERARIAAELSAAESRRAAAERSRAALDEERRVLAAGMEGAARARSALAELQEKASRLSSEAEDAKSKAAEASAEARSLSPREPFKVGEIQISAGSGGGSAAWGIAAGIAAGLAVALGALAWALADERGFLSGADLKKATGMQVLAVLGESSMPRADSGVEAPPRTHWVLGSVCALAAFALALAAVPLASAVSSRGSSAEPMSSGRSLVPAPERRGVPARAPSPATRPAAPHSAGGGERAARSAAPPPPVAPAPPDGGVPGVGGGLLLPDTPLRGDAATPEGGHPGTEAAPGRLVPGSGAGGGERE